MQVHKTIGGRLAPPPEFFSQTLAVERYSVILDRTTSIWDHLRFCLSEALPKDLNIQRGQAEGILHIRSG